MPASWGLLRERLEGRKSEAKEVVEARMKENVGQVQKMIGLTGTKGIFYVTNF